MNRISRIGLVGFALLVVLSALAVLAGLWKLLAISWVAFAAMAGATPLGVRAAKAEVNDGRRIVWGYGLASGAMVTSAAVFLVPQAIAHDPSIGGFGVALGLLAGFSAHTIGHRLTHREYPFDHTALELSAHSLAAGSIIGLVYAALPSLGPLLGLAIVSHKGPAGYVAARRLESEGKSASVLLLPAAGVGITAIPAGLLSPPGDPVVQAVVFGFASGVFLHVAMDFLPHCEFGSEISDRLGVSEGDHALLDRLRTHAVASTSLGGLAVFLAWAALAG
jgi:ZIP family zinc transporter